MDKYEQAASSLGKLRRLPVDHPAIVEELGEVQANHLYEMSLGKSTYADCFKGTLGKRLATGCLLQALQQLTGVNFIFYYSTPFLASTGAISNTFLISLIFTLVNVCSTPISFYTVDKLTLKKLRMISSAPRSPRARRNTVARNFRLRSMRT